MKIKVLFLVFLASLFHANSVVAQKKRPAPKPKVLSAREIAAKVLPSVVLIITQDENGQPIAQGSGFIYRPGLVVSNLHVFERASNAIVKDVKTGEFSKVIEVVAMNAKDDICVIRIDNTKFPFLALGDSDSVRTGDEIYVASNPKGLEGTITKGIISSVRKREGIFEPIMPPTQKDGLPNLDEFALPAMFQIDAAISSGSSGGVLLNAKAEAVGIIRSSLVSGQNLNFAIPINKLKTLPHKYKNSIQLAGSCAFRDRTKERLIGVVKTVTEKSPHSKIVNGRLIDLGLITESIQTYDLDGNLIENEVYDVVTGKFAWKWKYEYDENRIKTRAIQTSFRGTVTKEIVFDFADGIYNKLYSRHFSTSIDHDPTGRWTYNGNGELSERRIDNQIVTYQYDSNGRELQTTTTQNGRIQFRNSFTYKNDERGNWIIKYSYYEIIYALSDPDYSPSTKVENFREISYYD